MVERDLQRFCCVLQRIPMAALDNLREGEIILPLPQPASLSDVKITLCNLMEQHRTLTACSTLKMKQRKSENGVSRLVSPNVRSTGSASGAAAVAREGRSRARRKLLPCTTFDEGERSPQSQGRREPSGGRAVVLSQTAAKSHHQEWKWLPFS